MTCLRHPYVEDIKFWALWVMRVICQYRRCEYGNGVFMNFDCKILDAAPVHIGDNTLIGPVVMICTAAHPTDLAQRLLGLNQL